MLTLIIVGNGRPTDTDPNNRIHEISRDRNPWKECLHNIAAISLDYRENAHIVHANTAPSRKRGKYNSLVL